jgi:hypothetical protein
MLTVFLLMPSLPSPRCRPDLGHEAEQHFFQDAHVDRIKDRRSAMVSLDQAGLAQLGEMARHGRLRHVERVGQFACRARSRLQQFEYLAPDRVRQRLEDLVHRRTKSAIASATPGASGRLGLP